MQVSAGSVHSNAQCVGEGGAGTSTCGCCLVAKWAEPQRRMMVRLHDSTRTYGITYRRGRRAAVEGAGRDGINGCPCEAEPVSVSRHGARSHVTNVCGRPVRVHGP